MKGEWQSGFLASWFVLGRFLPIPCTCSSVLLKFEISCSRVDCGMSSGVVSGPESAIGLVR